ncbi:MAG: ATP-binding protein [Anaerolineales bacterium]
MLSIRLFGPPHIELDGQPVNVTRRKSRALVYYLAAHPQPRTREHLLAFFWPDHDRPAAQQLLRTTLHGLRRTIGPALQGDEAAIGLAPDADVDARTFEAQLSPPTSDLQLLTSTLALYRGDFLADFSLPDTPAFEDWTIAEQERYRRLAVRGLTALSQQHEADQDYPAALGALERALSFDALQEDLQRAALRLHYLAGDRAGAIRRYETLRKLLDEEMGVPPMGETRAVYDSIINDTLPKPERLEVRGQKSPIGPLRGEVTHRPPSGGGSPSDARLPISDLQPIPFAGRSAELQTLRALSASGKLALIEGEPGLGKTRLAEEFISQANAITLSGAAREMEGSLPYQPIVEALRGLLARPDWPALRERLRSDLSALWLAEVARLLPELSPGLTSRTSPSEESRLWEGLFQFLLALARQQPVILFLDDLHWADASTLALLGYLTRKALPALDAPVFLMAATRSPAPRSPLGALVQTLTREGRLARLPLARLSRAEVESLARQLCSAHAKPLTEWLTQSSEGNPYILAELLRYVREKDILRSDGALDLAALRASPLVPQTVYSLIQSRLARLSDAARRMLDAAVPLGREFEFEIAARAAALSENAALDALDELRAAGLIHANPDDPNGRLFTFDHTLTMEVAYREVSEPRHRLMHRRVAEALESAYRGKLDAVAGLLASHFAEGNAPERAAPYAFRAGQLAAGLAAWKEAIAFYEQALTGITNEAQRADVFLALGQARLQAGETAQASEAFRAALAHPNPEKIAAAQVGLSQSLLAQNRFAEVIELARQLLTALDPFTRGRGEALWGTALSVEGTDLAGAAEHLQQAAAILRDESGPVDPVWLGQITFELGSVAAQQGDLPRAITLYRDALALAQSVDSEASVARRILAHNNLAYHLHLLGDPSALEHARLGLRLAQEKGTLGLQTYLLSTLGEIELAQEDLDAAEKYFTDGLALAEQLSIPERIAGLTANLGRLATRRGQTALAIHRLSTALARADALGTRHLAAQIRLWLVPLLPPAEARAALAEARAIAESGGRKRLLEEAERLGLEVGG